MNQIQELTKRILKFRDAREWKQFHNPKDLALSLMLETAEVVEHFQWKNSKEIDKYLIDHKEDIAEEIADVFYWILLISHDLNIDLIKSFDKKMLINETKYPIEKSRGSHTKYNKL